MRRPFHGLQASRPWQYDRPRPSLAHRHGHFGTPEPLVERDRSNPRNARYDASTRSRHPACRPHSLHRFRCRAWLAACHGPCRRYGIPQRDRGHSNRSRHGGDSRPPSRFGPALAAGDARCATGPGSRRHSSDPPYSRQCPAKSKHAARVLVPACGTHKLAQHLFGRRVAAAHPFEGFRHRRRATIGQTSDDGAACETSG